MLKGLGDIGNMMKLQKEFKNIQKKITNSVLVGVSPNGKVSVEMAGDYKVKEITIDPGYLKDAEPKELEKMLRSAFNNAVDAVKYFSNQEMEKLAGGLGLPGLGGMFK
ncbi:MAG: YbaB/EbfC family nucleoid-associated protein [Spirochaetes bacterium]|nr:YbaB/EbfC family nucleoid-associated protein [Spirochaetota bacterium]